MIAGSEGMSRSVAGVKRSLRGVQHVKPRVRALAKLAGDVGLFAAGYGAAYQIRFDFAVPPDYAAVFRETLPAIVAVKLAFFLLGRQYRGRWRDITFPDAGPLLAASAAGSACLAAANAIATFSPPIPRAVLLVDFMAAVLLTGAARAAVRFVQEALRRAKGPQRRRAILVGAGPEEKVVAARLHSHPRSTCTICGCLDHEPVVRGRRIAGLPTLGGLADVAAVAAVGKVTDVVVFSGCLAAEELRALRSRCREIGLTLRIIGAPEELLDGSDEVPLRRVTPDRLLRRQPVRLDPAGLEAIVAGACVMVTGSGGSIGSELCRQLVQFRPERLLLLERSEPHLFTIDSELRGGDRGGGVQIEPCLGSVTDAARMRRLFERYRPQVIFHAAAHKHVPLLEGHPGEAVKNNVLGTATIADLADEYAASRFVLISTDKAVKPANVMGASKRLAEDYVIALAAVSAQTKFTAVRFGNVLGSNGSVLPTFQRQLRAGGPLTVTHSEVRRFFMTIAEAAQLVLHAAALAEGGEVFVLDMGEPVRIADLAGDLIRLCGLSPSAVEIVYSGLRPGEKLDEELLQSGETGRPTSHPKISRVVPSVPPLAEMLDRLSELKDVADGDEKALLRRLSAFLPGFLAEAAGPAGTPNAEPPILRQNLSQGAIN